MEESVVLDGSADSFRCGITGRRPKSTPLLPSGNCPIRHMDFAQRGTRLQLASRGCAAAW